MTRKHIPNMPEYAAKIVQLQKDLKEEREVVDALCRNLEDPSNWVVGELAGEDPDAEQLRQRFRY